MSVEEKLLNQRIRNEEGKNLETVFFSDKKRQKTISSFKISNINIRIR